jgi:predicted ATPase/DNA-binding SARP family transcriptional activator
MMVSIRLLGPVGGDRGDVALGLGGPLQRGVLAQLALAAPQPVAPEALTAGLWGDDAPAKARETLRAYLSRLRSAMGPEHLVRAPGGHRLVVEAIDVHRFTGLAAAGRTALGTGDLDRGRADLEDALALWRGEALAGVRHLPFATVAAARLDEARAQATEDLLDVRLRAGEHGSVIDELQAFATGAPLRERAAALLMLALYRAGRQAEALGVYTQLRTRLVDELGVEPGPDARTLQQRILSQDPALLLPAPSSPEQAPAVRLRVAGGVPNPLTSFIGRAEELTRTRALLDMSRLVTLTGPGGSGKTRLALELVRTLPPGAVGEPWFIELAGLEEGHLVASAVASALGVAATSQEGLIELLAGALTSRTGLLVLDNCEHVIDDVALLVERLLQHCPGARVLATSREPLGVPGECTMVVPVLPTRSRGADGEPSEAVQLFVERAGQVVPGFRLDEGNRQLVTSICRELDGIPLAIELAAARLQLLSLEQIAQMLDDRFALLTSGSRTALPRHRTLMAAVAWSFDLLHDDERRLFAVMSVFRDGFCLDALQALVPGPGTLDTLAQLIAKSMVTVDCSGQVWSVPRYRLLETLREFAGRQLTEVQRRTFADAHAGWCTHLAEEAERHLRTADAQPWWDRLTLEQHNLRAGLRHALDSEHHERALRIAAALAWYWYRKGPVPEGRQWLTAALEQAGDEAAPLRARAHVGAAVLGYLSGDLEDARDHLARCAGLTAEGDDPATNAIAQTYLGFFEAAFGDPELAQQRISAAQELARTAPPWVQPEVLMTVGQLLRARGDLEQAISTLREARRMALAAGHLWCASSSGWIAAKALLQAERPAQAGQVLRQVVTELADSGDRTSLLAGLHTTAAVAAALGRSEDGAVLLGAVDEIGARIGFSPARMDPVDSQRHRAAVLQRLPESVALAAQRRGRTLTVAQAVRLALRIATDSPAGSLQPA